MPNFAAIYALNAGLRYLKNVGVNELVQAADLLTESLHSGLLAQGISPMAPRRRASDSGIVAFQHPRSDAIHAALQKDNIHVMHQAGRLRVSVHGYNNEADIASFLHNLAHALNGLSSKL
jgi:selenocysteine lyase/cysteine desulfurase